VASTVPLVTCWPALTLTAVTLPDTGKLRFSVSAGSRVPDADTVWRMVPAVTVTVRSRLVAAAVFLPDEWVPAHAPAPAATITGTTITGRSSFRRNVPNTVSPELSATRRYRLSGRLDQVSLGTGCVAPSSCLRVTG